MTTHAKAQRREGGGMTHAKAQRREDGGTGATGDYGSRKGSKVVGVDVEFASFAA